METQYRYNKLNNYLKNKYGERTLKICIDGGFTCPNRDGSLSNKGCIFCSQMGSGEHLSHYNKTDFSNDNIKEQISLLHIFKILQIHMIQLKILNLNIILH